MVLCGAILCFVGYLFIWLSVVGLLPRPPVVLMGFYIFLASQAATFFNTANVVTAVHNFPSYRGTVVGIMKGFLGLSGAILIQVYHTALKDKPTNFILMLAVLPPVSSVLLMWFVKIFPSVDVEEKKHLNAFSLASVIIAAYLMAVIIIQKILSLHLLIISTFVILIILLFTLPLCVVIKAQKEKSYGMLRSLLEHNQSIYEGSRLASIVVQSRQVPIGYHEVPSEAGDELDVYDNVPEMGENLNLLKAMCTVNFWFLFLTSASGMGSGLATVNNISQVGESLGYSTLGTSTLISLWSIWNFLGRFGCGYVSDYFLHVKGLSRPLFIAITLAAMGVGHAVIASGLPGALYLGSILVGVCYGSQWSLMPTVASEIFGSEHFGAIFNTITVANPIGTYVLSVRVVGYLYDKEASGSEKTCYGAHCFMLSFLIMASVSLLGSLIGLALFFRTRNLYKRVILPKLRFPQNEVE